MSAHPPLYVGVSLKTYFTRERARTWFEGAAQVVADHRAPASGVQIFVIPTYLQVHDAVAAFEGTGVLIGAQDVSAHPHGAFTGEVPAAELAESGVALAEIGHAERRRLFGESDADVAAKAAAAMADGITPLICIGEQVRMPAADAALATVAQLRAGLAGVPAGKVLIAYEPVWAIGAPEPAPHEHIVTVTRALRTALHDDPAREGSGVIYGGSAAPGLLPLLGGDVDGLFLGRFAHDLAGFAAVLDEATDVAERRARG